MGSSVESGSESFGFSGVECRRSQVLLADRFVYFTDPANAAGIHLTILGC